MLSELRRVAIWWFVACAAAVAHADILSDWYAEHCDYHQPSVINISVGEEHVRRVPKKKDGNYYYIYERKIGDNDDWHETLFPLKLALCNAELMWDNDVITLRLWGGEVGAINADYSLCMELMPGTSSSIAAGPIVNNKGSAINAYGIRTGCGLLIRGPGSLTVRHSGEKGEGISAGNVLGWEGDLLVAEGALVHVQTRGDCGVPSLHTDWGHKISIVGALLEARGGRIFAHGDMFIDRSVVNVDSSQSARYGNGLSTWGNLTINNSFCASIVEDGYALYTRKCLKTDNSIVYAFSGNDHCVNVTYDGKSADECTIGRGLYKFATGGGNGKSAIEFNDNRAITIAGGEITTYAPDGYGIHSVLGFLTINSGLVRNKRVMSIKDEFVVSTALLDAYGISAGWSSMEVDFTPYDEIVSFLGSVSPIRTLNGMASSLITTAGLYLNGGTLLSEDTETGVRVTDDAWSDADRTMIKGGSLQGPITTWNDLITDANGNRLVCVTNRVSDFPYSHVSGGWTTRLPDGYDTSSLYLDGECKLYFWVPSEYATAYGTYTVTYKSGSNGTGSQQSVTKTEGVALMLSGAVFTRTGYTQTGWTISDGGAKMYDLGAFYADDADVTLYPFWTAMGCTVSLDRQSGSGGTYVLTATYGRPMPSITVPSRSGYAFGGYYTGTNGGGVQYYTASGASARNWDRTSSTTLYAKWTEATTPTSFTFGGDASWVKQRDGSWKSGKIGDNESTFASTTMTGPGTISFKWRTSSESNYDKLHFYVNGSEPVAAISGVMDSWESLSHNVTASGSVTLKWEYEKDVSDYAGSDCAWIKDVTWTPKAAPAQTYILRLHRNNSERDGATAGRTYTIGKARALPKVQKELKWAPRKGYDFLGWARTANATTAQYTDGQSLKDLTKTAGATVHLYAVWKAHHYIVRLHRNNSKNDGATTGRAFDYDQVRFLPTMAELKWVRSGYMFLGWSQAQSSSTVKYADGLNVFNLSANDGEELHVWGVWKKAEPNAYLLRLHRNNSERDGATAGRQLKLNTNRKLPTVKELGWTRSDATFKGWATTARNAAAGKVTYKDGATVKNLVKTLGDTAHLYAVWQ